MEKKIFIGFLTLFMFYSMSAIELFPDDNDKLTLYPNPAKTDVTIGIELEFSLTIQLKIIDLTGKVVKDFSRELNYENGMYKAQLNISDLKTGIYFVRVVQQKTVISKKLIVK